MRWVAALITIVLWANPALADYEAAALYSAAHRGVSMVVILDGQVVFEDYANEGSVDQANPLASGTKSFTGIIAAAAVQDGLLTLDERVSETIAAWVGTPREPITIRQLLNLTDGLERRGRAGRPPPYNAAIRFSYEHPAGEVFSYHSVPFQIFGEIMRRKLGGTSPAEYLNARVLAPYGIEIDDWRTDRAGNPMMSAGAKLTGRNWALFGQLILDRGHLNGEPLVSPLAFEELFVGSAANPAYGLGFWLARPIDPSFAAATPPLSTSTDFWRAPDTFPSDMVMAAGLGDQRLYISWDRRLVVARQADGILGAIMGRSIGWSDVDFWRMLEAPTGQAPAELMAAIPSGLIAARTSAEPAPAITAPPLRRSLSPGPLRPANTLPPLDSFVGPSFTPEPEVQEPPTEDVSEEPEPVSEEDSFIGPTF